MEEKVMTRTEVMNYLQKQLTDLGIATTDKYFRYAALVMEAVELGISMERLRVSEIMEAKP